MDLKQATKLIEILDGEVNNGGATSFSQRGWQ